MSVFNGVILYTSPRGHPLNLVLKDEKLARWKARKNIPGKGKSETFIGNEDNSHGLSGMPGSCSQCVSALFSCSPIMKMGL